MNRRLRVTWLLALAAGWLGGCDAPPAHDVPGLLAIFGQTGLGPKEFSYPRAIARSRDGDFYIVDKAARIQCYDAEGAFVRAWRMPEWGAGKPTGLGIGPDGRVYAADTHYARVVIFDPNGTLLAQFGSKGTGPGQFIMPTDVAVAPDGSLYVGEYGGNDRVSKFGPDHQFLFSFGGPDAGEARLARPQALLLDPDGSLWVADACNHRICHFSAAGRLLGSFGQSGTGAGELRFPYGLDWLSDGTLVVAEYGNNRVQRFDRTGRTLGTWGASGRAPGQLAYPWAVAAGEDDRLYVLDSGNNRVQIIAGRGAHTWQQP
jgi:DNA-binding beta-propeller fold protein YncE